MKLLILLLLFGSHAFPQYKTGFTSITRYDQSRPAIEEQKEKGLGRIMQINLWYPADNESTKMTFGDYVSLVGLEVDSSLSNDYSTAGIDKYFGWPESAKADKKSFLAWLDRKIPMMSSRNAMMRKQKYPLVMLVHGFAADYAYLAEHLAERGFVVMQIPVKGTTKFELDYQDKGLESQVLDYEFGLEVLKKEFNISPGDIGVAGFSFGAQSAMAIAIRNNNVRSVISLDGGIGSGFGSQLLKSQSYYNVSKIKQPVLHLYNARDEYTDLSWIKNELSTNRFIVSMKNMVHGHFTSFGLLNKSLPGIMGSNAPDPGRGYEGVMVLTTAFLESSLKKHTVPQKGFITGVIKKNPWLKLVIEKEEFVG